MLTGVRDEKGIAGMKRGYIQMKYGYFNPIKPRVEDVDIKSIAYGLAGEYRYSAQSRLTVAQHSVVGSYYCDEPLAFLLHDAAEGLGFRDVTIVLKHSPALLGYRKLELKALLVIYEALKIPALWGCAAVKSTDRAMYVTESFLIWGRDIQSGETSYPFTLDQFDQTRLWSPEEAERRFLARYTELTGLTINGIPVIEDPDASTTVFAIAPTKPFDHDMQTFGRGSVVALAAFLASSQPALSPARTAGAITSAPSRPPNSFTHAEYVKENGVCRDTATRAIRKLHESGKVRPVKFRFQRSDGQWRVTNGWQLVDASIDNAAKNV